jgi:putative Mn2+ efflux pump MntP
MSLFDLILTGVALSMDAFAVAVCKGLAMRRLRIGHAVIVGLYFGIAQAVMPVIGYFLGVSFEDKIREFDHWIAFALLIFIGAKMLWEVLGDGKQDKEKHEVHNDSVNISQMLPFAIATSIDALAVGVSFAFLNVNILPAVTVIGLITFILSFAGVGVGCFFGSRFRRVAQIAGGIILILLGVKILAEHLIGG